MRPCWLSTFLVIGKVHGAVLSHNMVGVCIFEDKIVGPAVANNQFSRDHDASITMSNNKFGRFRVIAPSLLVLIFLVIGQVRGPVLSRNRVGSGNSTTSELAVTSSSSSFFANAHLYFQRRRRWSSCHRQLPAQQECRRRDINDQQ